MAQFKTAWHQKADIVFATNAADLVRNDYVKLTPASGSTPASIALAKISEATHILAQGAITMNGEHIKTEIGDYNIAVSVSRGTAPSVVSRNVLKSDLLPISALGRNVALYKIIDAADVYADADGFDHLAE